jgi:cell division protein FtsW (lipid II flippase)
MLRHTDAPPPTAATQPAAHPRLSGVARPAPLGHVTGVVALLTVSTLVRARLEGEIAADGTLQLAVSELMTSALLVAVYAGGWLLAPLLMRAAEHPWSHWAALAVGLAGFAAVLTPVGLAQGSARVSLWIPGLGSVDPSAAAIVACSVGLALLAARFPNDRADGLDRLAPFVVVAAAVAGVLTIAGDLGPMMIMLAVTAGIAATVGRRALPLAALAVAGALVGAAASALLSLRSPTPLPLQRIQDWLGGGSEQVRIALAAVADAGWWGHGFGRGRPADIPLAAEDMTVAAIADEGGLAGVVLVSLAWLAILFPAVLRIRELDGTRAAVGTGLVTALAAMTAVVMGMAANLLPLSGLPLPGISTGKSALMTVFLTLGVLTRCLSQPRTHAPTPRLLVPLMPVAVLATVMAVAVATLATLETNDLPGDEFARHRAIDRQAAREVVDDTGARLLWTRWTPSGTPRRHAIDDPEWWPILGPTDLSVRPRGLADDATLQCRTPGAHNWIGADPCDTRVEVSIDASRQSRLHELIASTSASLTAVVMDPNGRVRAAGSSFDYPADQVAGDPDWDPAAFHRIGPAGSTLKVLLGAEMAATDPDTTVERATRAPLADGSHVHAWQPTGCGGPLIEALLLHSCNPAAITAIAQVGAHRWHQLLEATVGDAPTSPGLTASAAVLPATDDLADVQRAAIGQGSLQLTVADQARIVAAATTGEAPNRLLVRNDLHPTTQKLFDIETVAPVRTHMARCVTHQRCGTALAATGVNIAAKTGTGQRPTGPTVGSCVAAWPASHPETVAALRLEHPQQPYTGAEACDYLAALVGNHQEP